MVNSKNKGSKNERSVSKLLETWTGYKFARTPQSGGLHWRNTQTIGDIVCLDEKHGRKFPFSIECKFHAEADFSYMLDSTHGKKSTKLFSFWDQAAGDASKVNKTPMLFVRRNMMKAETHFVGVPTDFWLMLNITFGEKKPSLGIFHYSNENYHITLINSEDLFSLPYEELYRTALKLNRLRKKLQPNEK